MDKNLMKLSIGSVGILLLYFIDGIGDTMEWIKITLMGGLLSIFFFSPIYDLIMNRFTKEDLFLISIGILYAIIYIILTESTIIELITSFLQSLVMISIISILLNLIKEKVEEVIT
ncbi:MAG: hypothetical protein J7L32_04395 [Thermoplasmata archaeon]|nr:hypothetical protein [Thermoplasmata archaeon]